MASSLAVSRSVLLDIASSTSLDAGLATVCAIRPYAISVLGNQIHFIIALASQLKSCFHAVNRTHSLSSVVASIGHRHPGAASSAARIAAPSQLSVVVIGGGTVGRHAVRQLLDARVLHPSAVCVVTRQPEQLDSFSSVGVRCYRQDEAGAIAAADVVILACQPGQLPTVTKQVAGAIPRHALILSVCCGVSAEKIRSDFKHDLTMCTSVEVTSLSTAVERWQQEIEDDAIEGRLRHGAEAASNGEKISSATSAEGRRKQRQRDLADLSFPREWSSAAPREADDGEDDERFPFLDSAMYCLVSLIVAWSHGSIQTAEALLTVWGLVVHSGLRGHIVELLSQPDALRHIRVALESGGETVPPAATSPARSRPSSPLTSSELQRELFPPRRCCTTAWFARHVLDVAPRALLDVAREQFTAMLTNL